MTGWHKGIFWGLCIALGAMLLYRTHDLPLRDYRETRYAEIAREVLERQDWLVLHLNGSLYVNKPPLVSWLVALSFTAFGRNEGAARLPSVLAVLWTAVVVGWVSRGLFGAGSGLLGAALFLGAPGVQYYGRMLMSDTVAMACVFSATAAFLTGYLRRQAGWYRLGFALCGAGMLARGLLGTVYPIGALGLFLLLYDRQALRALPWLSGGLLCLGVAAPWFVLLEQAHPGFLYHQFVQQQLERFANAGTHAFVALPRWQILLSCLGFVGPMGFVLPQTVHPRHGAPAAHYLLWWLAVLVLGSVLLSAGRNHPYTLPALPPLVALAAGWFSRQTQTRPAGRFRLPAALLGLLTVGVLASLPWVGTWLSTGSPLLREVTTHRVVQGCLALVALLLGVSSAALWRRRPVVAGGCLAMLMLPGAYMLTHVQEHMAPQESRAMLARLVAQEVPAAWPVIVANPQDQQFEGTGGWGFYAQRQVRMVAFGAVDPGALQGLSRPAWLLDLDTVTGLWQSGQPFALAATAQAVRQLPLVALPAPRAHDAQFTLWLVHRE